MTKLHALVEGVQAAPQGTKPWPENKTCQQDVPINKMGLGLATSRPSTCHIPSVQPKGGGYVDTWLLDNRLQVGRVCPHTQRGADYPVSSCKMESREMTGGDLILHRELSQDVHAHSKLAWLPPQITELIL